MDRNTLRVQVWRAHLRWVPGQGLTVLCPWCQQPIRSDYALHEYLVKRSAVPVAKQHLIMVPENCIPWHNEPCHLRYGQTKEGAWRSLQAATRELTARAVGQWYVSLWKQHGLSVPRGTLPPGNVHNEHGWRSYLASVIGHGFPLTDEAWLE